MPGKSWSRWRAITASSGTKTESPSGMKRGSTSFGTLTRAKVSAPETGSRSQTASESDRLEMYGNGRPGPTASGVSTGKICSENTRSTASSSAASQDSQSITRMPCSARAGCTSRPHVGVAPAQLARALGDAFECLARRQAVGAAGVDSGVHHVVEPGHADHEELVEVRRVDGEELDPLEQRDRLVLGQLQHALVELEPGELAVGVQLGGIERGCLWRCGDGFHQPLW